jgi:hypothetical protein
MGFEDMNRVRRGRGPAVVVAAGLVACACLAAAEVARLQSAWAATPPVIDGDLAEWEGQLMSAGGAQVSVGVRNDAGSLYVAVAASDPGTRLLLGRAGFTVWWDVKGKTSKDTGVIVPAVFAPVDPSQRRRGAGGGSPGEAGRGSAPGESPDGTRQRQAGGGMPAPPLSAIGHLVVVGPKKDDQRRLELAYLEKLGVSAAAAMREGVLSYEFRFPRVKDEAHPHAIAAAPFTALSLGIESGKLEFQRPDGARPGGMGGVPGGGGGRAPGGMGGGMGGRGGGRGGPGGEGFKRPDPVKAWLLVTLAPAPAS